jgi:hypothetical protein
VAWASARDARSNPGCNIAGVQAAPNILAPLHHPQHPLLHFPALLIHFPAPLPHFPAVLFHFFWALSNPAAPLFHFPALLWNKLPRHPPVSARLDEKVALKNEKSPPPD